MRKAYLFVETGETRKAKDGEYVLFDEKDGDIYRATDFTSEYPILTRHEIEIPEGANMMTIQTRGTCNTPPALHFPIPRPKKMVKKWQWRCGNLWFTKEHFTEKQIKARSNIPGLSKVKGSEIEVEEPI